MDHLMRAAETLQKAERDLRDIVAKAAAGGDYAAVVQLASWAKTIHDLLETKPVSRGNVGNDSGKTVNAKNGRPARKKQEGEYPRFFRRGHELVRVAWSRRARSEYQHKTTQAVLTSIVDTLSRVGRKGRTFSTDEVLPLKDGQGAEVPTYQAYVCIALLKVSGLIEQHGRQGYSLSSPDDFAGAAEAIWTKLPTLK